APCFEAAAEAAEGSRWIHEPVEGDPVGPRLRTGIRGRSRGLDGSFSHPPSRSDPADGAPGPLALGAQDVLGDLGADRPAPATIPAVAGKQGLEATAAVGVVPGLDRARRELDSCTVRP